ncbi:unnamed protein product [Dovyalis caffra]|uniref:Uncharacterized protein n=1 Tax=Dovyalis caffra TaxID=77055 RepID=A0AAV1RA22_9ROSI|nr:unnamed protein product [Dovyalis caffra]
MHKLSGKQKHRVDVYPLCDSFKFEKIISGDYIGREVEKADLGLTSTDIQANSSIGPIKSDPWRWQSRFQTPEHKIKFLVKPLVLHGKYTEP